MPLALHCENAKFIGRMGGSAAWKTLALWRLQG